MKDPRGMLRRVASLVAVRKLFVRRAEAELAVHANLQHSLEARKSEALHRLQAIEGERANVWIRTLGRLECEALNLAARSVELEQGLREARRDLELTKRLRDDVARRASSLEERQALESAGEAAARAVQVSRKA